MFTLLILFIYRIGNRIPVPYVDVEALRTFFDQTLSNTVLGFYNTLSGSAFSEATILALSIQPYINASIIIQLLTIAIPSLRALRAQGTRSSCSPSREAHVRQARKYGCRAGCCPCR